MFDNNLSNEEIIDIRKLVSFSPYHENKPVPWADTLNFAKALLKAYKLKVKLNE